MKVNRKIKCYVLPLKASCFSRSEKKFLTPAPVHLSQAQAQSAVSVTLTSGFSFCLAIQMSFLGWAHCGKESRFFFPLPFVFLALVSDVGNWLRIKTTVCIAFAPSVKTLPSSQQLKSQRLKGISVSWNKSHFHAKYCWYSENSVPVYIWNQ